MNSTLVVGLLGLASSIVAELISWLSKKLQGTPLQGSASFIVAAVIAFIGAGVKLAIDGGQGNLFADFSYVFSVSEVYFNLVAKNLGLTVSAPQQ